MEEKGKRRKIHGFSWHLNDDKEVVYEKYLVSDDFKEEVASNNLTMGVAVSSLITVIGLVSLFGLNSYYANVSVFSVVPSEWVYVLLLLTNLPNLLLLLWLKRHRQRPDVEIRICFANLAVNAFLSGLTLYSTQEGSSYFFELVLMMTVICVLPYYKVGRGAALVTVSLLSTLAIVSVNRAVIAWQDAYDLFIFFVVCQACIILRRRWFQQTSWYNYVLNRANGSLFVSSRTDELTGLFNRLALREDFPNYIKQEVGVAMVDLDNFKKFNDNYGHTYGDLVLQKLGHYLQQDWTDPHLRCYRYGGDEVLIIASGLEKGAFVEKLRIFQAEYAKLNRQLREPATLSIGYCTSRIDNEEQLRQAIAQADDCLYRAKDRGKNQIIGQERT